LNYRFITCRKYKKVEDCPVPERIISVFAASDNVISSAAAGFRHFCKSGTKTAAKYGTFGTSTYISCLHFLAKRQL